MIPFLCLVGVFGLGVATIMSGMNDHVVHLWDDYSFRTKVLAMSYVGWVFATLIILGATQH